MSLDEFLMEYHLKMYVNYKEHYKKNNEMLANDNFFKLLLIKIKQRTRSNKLFGKKFFEELK